MMAGAYRTLRIREWSLTRSRAGEWAILDMPHFM
jgi:hypothetical protein